MKAFRHMPGVSRAAGSGVGLMILGALLVAGCSASGPSASSAPAEHNAAGIPAASRPGSVAAGTGSRMAPAPASLTRLAPPGSQAIIETASMTVRTKQVAAAATRAAQLAEAAGGYVASEHTNASLGHPAGASVFIQLKIPVFAYDSSLAALARLGTRLSLFQQAQDATQTVADVTSRVTSSQAAIAQLRRLLARAGSVSSLLAVQNQINEEEAGLEALQAQQRALARQTTYATVSLKLVSTPPPAVKHHRAGGFGGGLSAGWRAMRATVSGLLTVTGAALPFALPVALVIAAWFGARHWRTRRGAGTSQAS